VARKKTKAKKRRSKAKSNAWQRFKAHPFRWLLRGIAVLLLAQAALILLFALINPPTNFYMLGERFRLGPLKRDWVAIEDISADFSRAVVAAEDANFCLHYGFDLSAIREAVTNRKGQLRGASTITQQVAKNVFLWPGRSWVRKLLEAETTAMIEIMWTKRRILEVYVNIVELDAGVFGVGAAGPHYFGVKPANLTLLQSARLAAVLPSPKTRSASRPSDAVRRRTKSIMSGARTIAADGRDSCFQS